VTYLLPDPLPDSKNVTDYRPDQFQPVVSAALDHGTELIHEVGPGAPPISRYYVTFLLPDPLPKSKNVTDCRPGQFEVEPAFDPGEQRRFQGRREFPGRGTRSAPATQPPPPPRRMAASLKKLLGSMSKSPTAVRRTCEKQLPGNQ